MVLASLTYVQPVKCYPQVSSTGTSLFASEEYSTLSSLHSDAVVLTLTHSLVIVSSADPVRRGRKAEHLLWPQQTPRRQAALHIHCSILIDSSLPCPTLNLSKDTGRAHCPLSS